MRFILTIAALCSSWAQVEYVNTLIGTGGAGFGIGSLNPGPQVPFGAMRLGPDSTYFDPALGQIWLRFNHFGGYYYNDTHIRAFSHTHCVGPGASDFGDFGIMVTRNLTTQTITNSAETSSYASRFSHDTEIATAGYYAVELEDAAALAEVSVSGTHSGIHRYTCHYNGENSDASVSSYGMNTGGNGSGANASNTCHLLLDVCHTTIQAPACKVAYIAINNTVSQPNEAHNDGATDAGCVQLQASVLQAGDLSGRGPLGGVYVHLFAIVCATTGNNTINNINQAEAAASAAKKQHAKLFRGANSGGGVAGTGSTSAGVDGTAQTLSPFASGLWSDNALLSASVRNATTTSGNMGAFISYNTQASDIVITARVGISFIDIPHARANLYAQQAVPASKSAATDTFMTFDEIRQYSTSLWNDTLSRVSVTWPSDISDEGLQANATSFYSALYRTFLAPTTYSESDGSYLGFDQQVHTVAPGSAFHSDMSIWDIHRSQAPLLILTAPQTALDVGTSLLLMTEQGGHLPRWPLANVYTECMDGSHAVVILVDQVMKGLPGVNATAIMQVSATAINAQDTASRYASIGYVPVEDSDHSVTSTLEYAYDDGIAALLAQFVGDNDAYELWSGRSKNYRNVFHPVLNQMCPRYANGTWACPSDFSMPYPLQSLYLEGDAVQYQTFAPHDQEGLMSLFNSTAAYVTALQALQTNQVDWPLGNVLPNPWYWAGNEPDILSPWQFAVAGNGEAWRTQYWTRWLLSRYYTPTPDGIPGNDDFGTMSAWAFFAYVGVYPITGTQTYALGSPFFQNVTFYLSPQYLNARDDIGSNPILLQIIAHNVSVSNVYVAAAAVNGRQLPTPYVNHSDLVPTLFRPDCTSLKDVHSHAAGYCSGGNDNVSAQPGVLEFWMTDQPTVFGSMAAHSL